LNRHPNLKGKRAQRIDAARFKEVLPENVTEWFTAVERVIRDYDVKPENIYNMDETGFSIGSTQAGYVIVDDNVQSQFQIQPGRQE
jgi:hypothetical protein